MSDYGTIVRNRKTRSVTGAEGGVLTRCFQEGKFWYIEAEPMGTKDKVGYDWGIYLQLHKRPTESGRLAITGKTKTVVENNERARKAGSKNKRRDYE